MLDYVSPEVLSTEVDDLLARLPSSDSAMKGLLEEMRLSIPFWPVISIRR
ncbi:MAG: hypothetical protein H6512_14330 [Acidimicrobiia bacterium]|nr:hypothetical protein [Acidimicrobiia bacterium]